MATIVKTKDLMIEVARQLFARVGFTNTTMNDIADASKKGRRTLYTYFRNKDEIFHAVIERELERLWHDLELIRRSRFTRGQDPDDAPDASGQDEGLGPAQWLAPC